jgi:hypothetical protein
VLRVLSFTDHAYMRCRLLGFAIVVLVLVGRLLQTLSGPVELELMAAVVLDALQASPAPPYADDATAERTSTDRVKLVAVTTPLLLLSSFYAYYSTLGSLATLMAAGMGGLGLFGAWVVRPRPQLWTACDDALKYLLTHLFCLQCLFYNEKPSLSKTTRADKRTSSFPFANKASARSINDRLRWQPTRPADQPSSARSRPAAAARGGGDPLGAAGEEIELKQR